MLYNKNTDKKRKQDEFNKWMDKKIIKSKRIVKVTALVNLLQVKKLIGFIAVNLVWAIKYDIFACWQLSFERLDIFPLSSLQSPAAALTSQFISKDMI